MLLPVLISLSLVVFLNLCPQSLMALLMVMALMTLMILFSHWHNTLMILLTLEVLTLIIILLMGTTSSYLGLSSNSFFSLFTLAVCEASIGLSLLIKTCRKTGSTSLN